MYRLASTSKIKCTGKDIANREKKYQGSSINDTQIIKEMVKLALAEACLLI